MDTQTIIMLPPESLLADANIRYALKQSRIDSLADSILEQGGVMVPLEIESSMGIHSGAELASMQWRIVDGHYRHAAVAKLNKDKSAGLELPCIPVKMTDSTQRMKRQIASAVEREELNPLDMGYAIKRLMEAKVPRQEIRQIFAVTVGKKRVPISNSKLNMYMSFLDFPKDIRNKIQDGAIGVSGAYQLTRSSRDKWSAIVGQLEKDRDAVAAQEARDEEKFNAGEAKVAEARSKAKKLSDDLVAARRDFTEKAKAVDEFSSAESDAYKAKGASKSLTGEDKKAAEEQYKLAEANTKAAVKLAGEAQKLVQKLEDKAKSADDQVETRRKALEDARKLSTKKKDKPASRDDVAKAASKVGEGGPVPLSAPDMRKAVDEWSLPGSFDKVSEIAKIIKECFAGVTTPAQAYTKMGRVTGEKTDKRLPKTEK
jgi:hypothetical protein